MIHSDLDSFILALLRYGKPKEATGVKFSEYQSLAVPPYVLVVVLLLFLAAAAYVIFKIFDTQQEKGQRNYICMQRIRSTHHHRHRR